MMHDKKLRVRAPAAYAMRAAIACAVVRFHVKHPPEACRHRLALSRNYCSANCVFSQQHAIVFESSTAWISAALAAPFPLLSDVAFVLGNKLRSGCHAC